MDWFLLALYAVARPSFVHPTQAIEIFGNVSTPFGTLAIYAQFYHIVTKLE